MVLKRPKSVTDQVISILRDRIRDKGYPEGRLPSEHQLAEEFGVSRATIRTALAKLASEGLIIRKHGDGTYVNEDDLDANTLIGAIWEFTRMIKDSGREPGIRGLSSKTRLPTQEESEALDIDSKEPVVVIHRLFTADAEPVILSKNVIPTSLYCFEGEETDIGLSIHHYLNKYCERSIAYAIADICAILAKGEVAEALELKIGSPLLQIEEVFYSQDRQPLVYATNFYENNALRLRVVRPWD
jgi:GntR family transcriptional regulator